MKHASLRLLLAISIGASVTACDLGPVASKARKSMSKATQTFLEEAGGTAQEQAGRSIVKDSIAILQADLESDIGSSLAEDATFGTSGTAKYRVQGEPTLDDLRAQLKEVQAKIATLKSLASPSEEHKNLLAGLTTKEAALKEAIAKAEHAAHNTTGGGSSTTGNSNGSSGSGNGEADELRKKLENIQKEAKPLLDKLHAGQKLTEQEARALESLKKSHSEVAAKLEALKKSQNGGSQTTTEKKPEPPKVDPNKKPPEPPKEHARPEEHLNKSGGGATTKTETGSADVAELRKKLEELQKANEQLRKQQEELRAKTEELRKKLEEIAKKRAEHEKKQKELAKNVEKNVVDNGDGTLTYSMKMETEWKGAKTTHQVSKTVNALTKELIEEACLISKTLSNGTTIKIGRTRKQNEDGSWSATFSSEISKGDKTKKVDWNKTVNADGSGSAQGKIERADGSVVTIEITRDADGSTHTVAHDTKHKVKAEVEKDSDVDTTADAKIIDSGTGDTIAEVEIADTETVEPTAD